jgi:hypothetical protein
VHLSEFDKQKNKNKKQDERLNEQQKKRDEHQSE